MKQRIVCAANKNRLNGSIVLGVRHHDKFMMFSEDINSSGWIDADQGFIDQQGFWLTRQEAWKVAEAAGQIIRRCGGDEADGGTLYSENLY